MTYRTTLPQQIVGDLGTIKVDRTTLISPTKDTIASEENKKVEAIVELFERVGLDNMTIAGSHENRIYNLETSVTGAIGPATTVMGEVAFGLTPAVGTGSLYARHDHTHGSPPPPGGSVPCDTVVDERYYGQLTVPGTSSLFSRGDHSHGTPDAISASFMVVGETTYGLIPNVGASLSYAREDHTHGSPPTAPPVSGSDVISEQTYGQVPSPGISSSYAKEDHTHGTPSIYYPAFTSLPDSPGTYAGAKGQIPVVNVTETGLEWLSGTTDFIDLLDVPVSYAGQANQFVSVRGDEKGLEFISSSAGIFPATTVMGEVTYGISPVVGTGSLYARHDHTHGTPAVSTFLQLPDTPSTFAGKKSMVTAVNAAENAVEFVSSSAGASTFLALTDTPSTYAGQKNMIPAVNAGETALAFISASSGGFSGPFDFQHRSTGGGWDTWMEPMIGALDSGAVEWFGYANYLYGFPIVVPGGGVIDKINIRSWLTVGNKLRAGIYKATSTSNLYPNALIADFGEKSAPGANSWWSWTGLSVTISPNELYWIAFTADVTFGSYPVIVSKSPLGRGLVWPCPAFSQCYIIRAYGALPATFPASATISSNTIPVMMDHLSS